MTSKWDRAEAYQHPAEDLVGAIALGQAKGSVRSMGRRHYAAFKEWLADFEATHPEICKEE